MSTLQKIIIISLIIFIVYQLIIRNISPEIPPGEYALVCVGNALPLHLMYRNHEWQLSDGTKVTIPEEMDCEKTLIQ